MTDIKVGKNYGDIFGYDAKNGKEIIYVGGNNFRIINKDKGIDTIKESQATYNKIMEWINKPHISMGSPY